MLSAVGMFTFGLGCISERRWGGVLQFGGAAAAGKGTNRISDNLSVVLTPQQRICCAGGNVRTRPSRRVQAYRSKRKAEEANRKSSGSEFVLVQLLKRIVK